MNRFDFKIWIVTERGCCRRRTVHSPRPISRPTCTSRRPRRRIGMRSPWWPVRQTANRRSLLTSSCLFLKTKEISFLPLATKETRNPRRTRTFIKSCFFVHLWTWLSWRRKSIDRSIYWLIDWSMYRLIDWLIDLFIVRLIDWFIRFPVTVFGRRDQYTNSVHPAPHPRHPNHLRPLASTSRSSWASANSAIHRSSPAITFTSSTASSPATGRSPSSTAASPATSAAPDTWPARASWSSRSAGPQCWPISRTPTSPIPVYPAAWWRCISCAPACMSMSWDRRCQSGRRTCNFGGKHGMRTSWNLCRPGGVSGRFCWERGLRDRPISPR